MKIFKMPELSEAGGGSDYLLGPEQLKSNSLYLLYTRLHPGEAERAISAKDGHEEILYVVKGNINVKNGRSAFQISSGEAFQLKANDKYLLENSGDKEAVFITAGSHLAKEKKEAPEDPAPENPSTPET